MNKDKLVQRIVWIALFVAFFVIYLNYIKSQPEPEPVKKIVVYYTAWSMDVAADLSCRDLVTFNQSVILSGTLQVTEFMTALSRAELREFADMDSIDPRICCLLYDRDDSVVKTISFSRTMLMQIDDITFEADGPLFQLVLRYLPSDYLET